MKTNTRAAKRKTGTPPAPDAALPPTRPRMPRRGIGRVPIQFTKLANVWPRLHDLTLFEATFDKLGAYLTDPNEFATKAQMPLVKMGTFGTVPSLKGFYRHDANVNGLSGIEGDYDLEVVPLTEAARRLKAANVAAYLYTSPSHTPEKPRWRVLCPFVHLYEDDTAGLKLLRRRMMERLQGVLGADIPLSSESWTLSQTYYIGRVKGAVYESSIVRGVFIDGLDKLPTLGKQGGAVKNDKGAVVSTYDDSFGIELIERFKTILNGSTFHNEVRDIAASFAGRGVPKDVTWDLLIAVAHFSEARDPAHPRHARWRELRQEIVSVVESGYAKYTPKAKPIPPDRWARRVVGARRSRR